MPAIPLTDQAKNSVTATGTATESRAGRGRFADLAVLLAYIALALLFTWPLVTVAAGSTLGDGRDAWQETWEMWWMKQAIASNSAPYHFATVYLPTGATNYLHSLNPAETLTVMPVNWLFGPIPAYAVACWLALVLTAFGGYLLARDITRNRAAAFVGGLAIGFAPHQMAQLLGHMDVASIQFFVFGVWCLYRSFTARSRAGLVWSLWSAACVAACALSHPYTLIAILLVLPLLALYRALTRQEAPHRWRPIAFAALSIIVGLAVASPLLAKMVEQQSGPDAPGKDESTPAEVYTYSADLSAYLIPSPFSPFWGVDSIQALRPLSGTLIEKVVYPGYVTIAFGLLALVTPVSRRRAAFWVVLAILGLLLSLGPVLHIGGNQTPVPLPGSLVYALPGTSILRVPARFSIILLLGLGICAALGTSVLLNSTRRAEPRVLAFGLITVLVLLELFPAPFRTSPLQYDPWYAQVASNPASSGGVLEVPFDRLDARPLETQLVSGQPLAGGYLSRQPVYSLTGGVPPFTQLGLNRYPGTPLKQYDSLCTPQPDPISQVEIMQLASVRYVVVHKDRLSEDDPRFSLISHLFPRGPVYRSEQLEVYDASGHEIPSTLFGVVEDTEDWGPVETGTYRWSGNRYSRLQVWSASERQLTLHFTLASFGQERQVTVSSGGVVLASQGVPQGGKPFDLSLPVDRGFHTILLDASGPPLSPKSLGLGPDDRDLMIQISSCRYEVR